MSDKQEERKTENPAPALAETRKLCATCGEKPTISDSCPYCPSCMRKRSKKKTASIISRKKAEAKTGDEKTHDEKAPVAGNMAVTVDFSGYPQILNDVRQLAGDEIRPLELQIVYLLKHHFTALKGREKLV